MTHQLERIQDKDGNPMARSGKHDYPEIYSKIDNRKSVNLKFTLERRLEIKENGRYPGRILKNATSPDDGLSVSGIDSEYRKDC